MESPGGVDAEKTPEKARGGEENSRQPEPEPQPPSWFPLFAVSNSPSFPTPTSSTGDPQWLCNTSFTADVSAFSSFGGAAVASSLPDDSDKEEAAAAQASRSKLPSYELVGSSTSSEEDRHTKPKERNKKKRKKRRRGDSRPDEDASRKSGVRAWAGSDTKPAKDYHVDVRGDRDNLAFGSLYRMDVARYRLQNQTEISGPHFHALYRWRSCLDVDGDLDLLDSKLRAGGRYFSAKYVSLERHKGLRHAKVVGKKPLVTTGEFIPLVEIRTSPDNGSDGSLANGELEESWEDEVLRRTRDFNRLSRDFPHDEKVWLAFADFQDKLASVQPKKAARLQRLEKKISILEKAVELNPSSEELLVCLLKSYQKRDSNEVLIERWEKVLMQHSSSCKLWKEFLLVREQEFSRFKVSDMRKTYAHAIQALSSACTKLRGQLHQTADSQAIDPDLVQLELGLVDIFINLCRFEWQTGHQEVATGLFQAETEYSLFCPSLVLSLQSKKRLFEHFWNGKGSRLGEDGAVGWSAWLEKEEHKKKNIIKEDYVPETGGWTGWMDPLSRNDLTSREPENPAEDVGVEENSEDDLETEVNQQEDNVEELLKKLGINIDADTHSEVKDPGTWNRWSKEESSRDYKQWMPVRENSEWIDTDNASDEERNEQLSRVVLFEDVREYLFTLCSVEARFCLVSRFIDFYGGRISQWACTNNSSWIENTLSLEMVPQSILEYLRSVVDLAIRTQSCSSDFSLDVVLGDSNCISRNIDMTKFLRNAILLCLSVFPRNYKLEEAVLVAEELLTTQTNPSICSITPSRALAKSLLKNDRQDLLLCGLYARREAAYGNIDVARKIFDMALSSIETLPLDLQENTPLLYFWYAEMEMATYSDSSEPSSLRTIHILSCLGAGSKYTPFRCQTSALQLLKAHQGFKENIKSLRSAWARGHVKDQSIALICSASLFEILTTGWAAGIDVIEEAFSMALPERRSQSLQIESLCNHYMGILQKHLKNLKLSRVWVTVLQALQTYPYNHKAFAAMIEVGCHYTVPYEIRRILDEYSQRKPSLIISLFALVFEFGKAGSQHRIRGLFERALANEKLQRSVILWRCYLAYEVHLACNYFAARRIFFRAIHACPWSKNLWLDGFQKLSSILTSKELSDLQEVMRDKELHLRTDIYEILLQDENNV